MTETWLKFLLKGGILMIPILLCSVFGLALILDRLYAYRKMKLRGFELAKGVKNALGRGDFSGAAVLLEGIEGAGARVLRGTFYRLRENPGSLRSSFIMAAAGLVREMEKSLKGLSTVATISPLLGLLGTVIGMIGAFETMAQSAGGAKPDELSGNISVALLTTAGGLMVAIPSLIIYSYLKSTMEGYILEMEEVALLMVDTVVDR